jgi:enediyne biosynthesis protein E4
MRLNPLFILPVAVLLFSRPATPGAEAPIPRPPIVFKDRTAELGLKLGGDAACWVDLDNDGWVDLCASGVAWKNHHGTNFTCLADVGLVVAADFDNDGFADLFSYSQMKLLRNEGGTGFKGFKLPELARTSSVGACWGDFDGDGFVDLYVGGFEDWDRQITYPSMILLNQQGRAFKLAWTEAKYRTRGVTACDFDRDGALDVYASNYRLQPNQLWHGDGKGRFKDIAADCNALATSPGFEGGHSIGAAWGDFDNDGQFDLFAGNFAHQDGRGDQPKSRFLRNLGPSQGFHFQDLGPCGVFYQESYASPAAGDFDNDGHLDLFFTTVYGVASFNRPNFPVLYHNDGKFAFSDATKAAGLAGLPPTYQAAWADFNRDGTLDLAMGGKLFVNSSRGGHWLEVRLEGDGQRVNRSAIGAQVRVKLDGETLTRQVEAGTGQGNQNDLTLHFGLDTRSGLLDLEISWPDRTIQRVREVRPDRLIQTRFTPPPASPR